MADRDALKKILCVLPFSVAHDLEVHREVGSIPTGIDSWIANHGPLTIASGAFDGRSRRVPQVLGVLSASVSRFP